MKFQILFLISLFSIYISQNIISSWTYDKVAMYDLQKINTFLTKNFKIDNIPITLTNDTLEIKDIQLKEVQTNLYDSLINYNTGLLLLTPNKITLNIDFTYTDKTKGSGTGNLELKIFTFKLKVKNNKSEGKAQFSIKMTTDEDSYSIFGIEDKSLLYIIKCTLYNGFINKNILDEVIPNQMEEQLYNYYVNYYKKIKNYNIITSDFFGNKNIEITNNIFTYYCEDPLGEYKNAFCYYSGNITNIGNIKDKSLIPLKNERFSHNDNDLYMLFINNDLFKDIMDLLAKDYFSKNVKIYNKDTNTKQLSYDFTVKSLKKYFIGLETLGDSNEFDCEITIESGNLNEAVYKVKVNIKDENKNNFEMRITSDLTANIKVSKTVKLKLCLSETKTKKIEIISSTTKPPVDISDLDGLKKAIEESFDFSYNPICFNSDDISLKDYFLKIYDIYIKEEGMYIEGKQLYQ